MKSEQELEEVLPVENRNDSISKEHVKATIEEDKTPANSVSSMTGMRKIS